MASTQIAVFFTVAAALVNNAQVGQQMVARGIGSSPIFPGLGDPVEYRFRPDRQGRHLQNVINRAKSEPRPREKQIMMEEFATSGTNAVLARPSPILKLH